MDQDNGGDDMSIQAHRSNDGRMEPCTEKSIAACEASAPDGSVAAHYRFDSMQAIDQWNRLALTYSCIPRPERRNGTVAQLLRQLISLQMGHPAIPEAVVARLAAAVASPTQREDEPMQYGLDLLTLGEKHAIKEAAQRSNTGSPDLDRLDLTAIANKLKFGGYQRSSENTQRHSTDNSMAVSKAKSYFLKEDFMATLTLDALVYEITHHEMAETKVETVYDGVLEVQVQRSKPASKHDAEAVIFEAYEEVTGLDILPISARKDLRALAQKWANIVVRTYDWSKSLEPLYPFSIAMEEYALIIEGLSPVINNKYNWNPR
ncbi:hypothetical protein H6A71_05300 [Bifidobacterium pullorum subsp. saeculare]|uniref:hypothetical protein n=1 Tax=Bifidobacterium pullorum TaxID=78448 RepID=UPI0019562D5F|nr:hypothetical protein [Bifidobacterium pullorum]MBM6692488.1 hypothetical protein [Bifidobacterium pullorum subsp. saeculare]